MLKFRLKFATTILFFVALAPTVEAGGPWLWKRGMGFFQAQFITLAYPYERLLNGTTFDSRNINRSVYALDYGLSAEYGLTDRLNIIANLPFKYAKVGGLTETPDAFATLLEEGSINGLSNIRIGLKYGILDSELKVAISASTSLNTVSVEIEKGLATGFQGTSAGLMGHVGGSFAEKWYVFGEIGFQLMFNKFDDSIEGGLEVGRSLGSKFNLALRFDIRQSLENGEYYDERLVQTGLYPSNQSWIAGSLKLNYEHDSGKYGFNFAMPLIPIKFQNVGYTGSFALGAYIKI